MEITSEQLVKLGATQENSDEFVGSLNNTLKRFNIDSNARVCHFMAQIFHESGNLSKTKEDLYYSAARLRQVWPQRFPTNESAEACAHNPVALGEKVYAHRMGNDLSGDGGKFLGRGLIQITGKFLYSQLAKDITEDIMNHPELLEEPQLAAISAGWFWNSHNLNSLADLDFLESVKQITQIINGGLNGLDDRQALWKKAKTIWADPTPSVYIAPVAVLVAPKAIPDQVVPAVVVVQPKVDIVSFLISLFRKK